MRDTHTQINFSNVLVFMMEDYISMLSTGLVNRAVFTFRVKVSLTISKFSKQSVSVQNN